MKYLWLPILVALLLPPALSRAGDELQAGIAAYEAGDFQAARRLLAPLAEGGNAEAQFVIGKTYFHGSNSDEDRAAAIGWFTKAAKQGFARALGALGYMANNGVGTAKDEKKALCLYIDAARRGHADSQWSLAKLFHERGNLERHDYWLSRAERQGQMYALGRVAEIWLLNPLVFDKTQAYLYLIISARKGDRLSADRLSGIRKAPSFAAKEQLLRAEKLAESWIDVIETPPSNLTPISDECYPKAK